MQYCCLASKAPSVSLMANGHFASHGRGRYLHGICLEPVFVLVHPDTYRSEPVSLLMLGSGACARLVVSCCCRSQFEVQRLNNELASHTRVAKRDHPLEPVIHLVDEQGAGRPGGHMGRTASMATATALSSLSPGRKHDEMAQRVIRMFKVGFS